MADSTLWWLAAGALIAIELLSGTLYLLLISLGMVAAAIAAHSGLAAHWQWVCAASVGGGSVLVWRRLKSFENQQTPTVSVQANPDVHMDVGEKVHVNAWLEDHTCSVKYRGAHWDAALQAGQMATPGTFEIAAVEGNRLILKNAPSF
ncbi:NfeD family protein [Rhodoferax sp.]|uniref:NfeD family protein n=1 Tax=Rhodoferax sp. TaxID=50421 RepID=UPI0026155014|nr:NfeD family protein [Rhodoferax sp.]MDD2808537.1 NfeD family protein [Rhodoferax sp.]